MTLEGKHVAFAGELVLIDEREAIRLAEEVGATVLTRLSGRADVLVVPLDGWLPDPDPGRGGLADRIREVRKKHELSVISEVEFAESVGAGDLLAQFKTQYTPAQLSRIAGTTPQEVRRWVRHGLLKPTRVVNRLPWFDFPALSHAKKLKLLSEAGIPLSSIKRAVADVVALFADSGGAITRLEPLYEMPVLRLRDGSPSELSGQMLLDFQTGPDADGGTDTRAARAPTPHAPRGAAAGSGGDAASGAAGGADHSFRPRVISFRQQPRSAEDWFAMGIFAEDDGDLERAERAYRNALLGGGPDAETCFNLGNVLYSLDRAAEASQRYLEAVEIDPNYVEAWNNLGNALATLDRYDDAIAAYSQALRIEPHYGEAHYNLADTLEEAGRRRQARFHWLAYLAEDPVSDVASEVKRRLGLK